MLCPAGWRSLYESSAMHGENRVRLELVQELGEQRREISAQRHWRAISDVSGHWTELFVLPVGRSVRPKGLHKDSEPSSDPAPPAPPAAE